MNFFISFLNPLSNWCCPCVHGHGSSIWLWDVPVIIPKEEWLFLSQQPSNVNGSSVMCGNFMHTLFYLNLYLGPHFSIPITPLPVWTLLTPLFPSLLPLYWYSTVLLKHPPHQWPIPSFHLYVYSILNRKNKKVEVRTLIWENLWNLSLKAWMTSLSITFFSVLSTSLQIPCFHFSFSSVTSYCCMYMPSLFTRQLIDV